MKKRKPYRISFMESENGRAGLPPLPQSNISITDDRMKINGGRLCIKKDLTMTAP